MVSLLCVMHVWTRGSVRVTLVGMVSLLCVLHMWTRGSVRGTLFGMSNILGLTSHSLGRVSALAWRGGLFGSPILASGPCFRLFLRFSITITLAVWLINDLSVVRRKW